VRRYSTEIVIPADRFVALQLPDDLPEGPAVLSISVQEPEDGDGRNDDADPDRQDIEWWEEFEDATL
jgi:hypothetical protein